MWNNNTINTTVYYVYMTDWGDHVFADLAEPSRQSGWQTGAIVRELHHEIEVLDSNEYKILADEGILIEKDIANMASNVDDYDLLEL